MLTRIMAEMGAEVIKIEPPGGDRTRQTPWVKNGRSAYNVQQNRSKKSVCVDLKNPAGVALVKQQLPKVDVLVENFAPGVIQRLGLGYKTVKSINPSIVMCSISSFGQSGPLASKVGFDFVAASYAGVINMMGFPDGPPIMPGLSLGDSLAAITGVGADCMMGVPAWGLPKISSLAGSIFIPTLAASPLWSTNAKSVTPFCARIRLSRSTVWSTVCLLRVLTMPSAWLGAMTFSLTRLKADDLNAKFSLVKS